MKWYRHYQVYTFETSERNRDGKILIAAVSIEAAKLKVAEINRNGLLSYCIDMHTCNIFTNLFYKCSYAIHKRKISAIVIINGIYHVNV